MRPEKGWFVYLIQCADKSLYCGISTDVSRRLAAHNLGKGAKYTRSRTPVALLATSCALTRSEALKLEDTPGALHHVIIRGIERGKIFRSDFERDNFTNRLCALIPETQTDCFAWALIP